MTVAAFGACLKGSHTRICKGFPWLAKAEGSPRGPMRWLRQMRNGPKERLLSGVVLSVNQIITSSGRSGPDPHQSRIAPVDSRQGKARYGLGGLLSAGPAPASVPRSCQNERKTAVIGGHPRAVLTTSHLDARGLIPCLKRPFKQPSDAPAAYAVEPGASADPAGLMAKARPGRHAANLLTQPPRLPNRPFKSSKETPC
jgi:hypothetical protein